MSPRTKVKVILDRILSKAMLQTMFISSFVTLVLLLPEDIVHVEVSRRTFRRTLECHFIARWIAKMVCWPRISKKGWLFILT